MHVNSLCEAAQSFLRSDEPSSEISVISSGVKIVWSSFGNYFREIIQIVFFLLRPKADKLIKIQSKTLI